MSRGRILFLSCSVILIGSLMLGGVGRPAWALDDDNEDSLYKYLSVFTEVLKLARTVYVEELDLRPLMGGALDGSADALDPFSVFVPKARIADYQRAREVGRGHSGLMVLRERGVAFVAALDEGSPAALAGVRRDDVIAELEGLSTRDMPMWQISEILTRTPGTKIQLEVVRQGTPSDITVELGQFTPAKPSLKVVDEFAVLRIPSFGSSTAAEVGGLLPQAGERPLVLDVRGTADRSPELGFALAELFVSGPLGSLESREQTLQTFANEGTPLRAGGEVAVLTDRGTMGAAEVLASVLRASGRGRTVGMRTFGFAGRSKQVKLSSGDLLELTDAFFAAPPGETITEGLEPDLEVARRFFRLAANDADEGEGPEAESGTEGSEARDAEVLREALRLLRTAEALAA
jgi:carboxyl-terminal processing protease